MKGESRVSMMSSVGELCRVFEANQQRMQILELAVANLTCICESIQRDIRSLGLSRRGSFKKVKSEANGMKNISSSPSLELKKVDMLGVQMQQLVQKATALGIIKEPKIIAEGQDLMQDVQTATKNHKRLIQTTENKIKNTIGSTPPKGTRRNSANNTKATPTTAKLSLKSTVKQTKTTISEVCVGTIANNKRSNETTKGSISNKPLTKKVERVKGKGSVKLAVKANEADNDNSDNAVKFSALTMTCASDTPVATDMIVRRKWNTIKEVSPK